MVATIYHGDFRVAVPQRFAVAIPAKPPPTITMRGLGGRSEEEVTCGGVTMVDSLIFRPAVGDCGGAVPDAWGGATHALIVNRL